MRFSGGTLGVALDHGGLDFDRAAHGVDHAAELDDRAVAGALDDASVVHGDDRVDQVAAERPEPRQRAVLVGPCEPAVAGDVGHQNRRELPGLAHSSGNPALRRPSTTAGMPDEWSCHHLTVSLGLRRRASAKATFASSILPAMRVGGGQVRVDGVSAKTQVDRLAKLVDRRVQNGQGPVPRRPQCTWNTPRKGSRGLSRIARCASAFACSKRPRASSALDARARIASRNSD